MCGELCFSGIRLCHWMESWNVSSDVMQETLVEVSNMFLVKIPCLEFGSLTLQSGPLSRTRLAVLSDGYELPHWVIPRLSRRFHVR